MSLPLNQTNPQLNDLLLRGGSSLSPELKEQAKRVERGWFPKNPKRK